MITITSSGDFHNTENFLKAMSNREIFKSLDEFGRIGVSALAAATPSLSGLSAASWSYEITNTGDIYAITWTNSNIVDGVPLVILLQYGHGTGTGGYVQGRDFINPALAPVFDKISETIWKAVTSA